MAMSLSSTYTGVVAAVNPKGLRLDGHDDWMNLSKFAPGVVLPERGATVTVAVDSKGFLRACDVVEGAMATNGHGVTSAAPGAQNAPGSQKDRTITRLAVLKAAAEYAASKATSSSADVLKIAASWERWVLRSDDPTDDLTEAF